MVLFRLKRLLLEALTATNRQPSIPYSRKTYQSFHKEPCHISSIGRQNMPRPIRLWHAPKVSRKLA